MSWNYAAKITPRPTSGANSPLALFIERTWTGVHAARAYLVDNADLEIAVDVNLARESNVWRELGFNSEAIAFEVSHFTGLAFEKLDAASGATSIAAAAVKDVDTGVFESQDQFLPGRRFGFDETSGGFSLDFRHSGCVPPLSTKGAKVTKGTKENLV
jgi:hypothetical protein